MDLMILLVIAVGILIMVILVLALFYIKMSVDQKNKKTEDDSETKEKGTKDSPQTYSKQSIFNFMEFDRIEDNMIIQKKGKRFLMVVECQGINYDLMSGVEKTSVESGFQQFLNTLRHPIQIYVQTRTINLGNSLQTYKKRLEDIKNELDRKELKYGQMLSSKAYSDEELRKQNMEIVRDRNLYEYGKDIIFYTERMSLNKSVLRKQYYIIIPYYSAEAGNDLLDKDEIKNLAFSELYTKAQSISRVLSGCSVSSKVLDSYELVDLLYSSYNRDEFETYGLEKALRAGYDELYSTAPDVLDKRMAALDRQVEEKAYELAKEMISEVRTEKQKEVQRKEESLEDLIGEMAEIIIKENEQYIGKEIATEATKKVKSKKTKEKGGEEDGIKEEREQTRRVAKQR